MSPVGTEPVKRPQRPPCVHCRGSCTWYFAPRRRVNQCGCFAEIHHANPRSGILFYHEIIGMTVPIPVEQINRVQS